MPCTIVASFQKVMRVGGEETVELAEKAKSCYARLFSKTKVRSTDRLGACCTISACEVSADSVPTKKGERDASALLLVPSFFLDIIRETETFNLPVLLSYSSWRHGRCAVVRQDGRPTDGR